MDKKIVLASVIGGIVGSAATLGIYCLTNHCNKKKQIARYGTDDPRSSQVVVHSGKVYISGQVGDIDQLAESSIQEQTQQILQKIEYWLRVAGTNKSNILEARIWLKNINTDFQAMNAVWNAWVDPTNKGVRYCVGAELARPAILVEIQVTAVL